jgi:hypothetical protein
MFSRYMHHIAQKQMRQAVFEKYFTFYTKTQSYENNDTFCYIFYSYLGNKYDGYSHKCHLKLAFTTQL